MFFLLSITKILTKSPKIHKNSLFLLLYKIYHYPIYIYYIYAIYSIYQ